MTDRILILGARSWIGYRLAQSFAEEGIQTIGTTASSPITHTSYPPQPCEICFAPDAEAISKEICQVAPKLVFNLLRWENEQGIQVHRQAARICADLGAKYLYASSALVFDGNTASQTLNEQAVARPKSAYGAFKAECEQILIRDFPREDWQVLRFASIHGWSPWRRSRTQTFLERLANGLPISVDRGIVQNRLLDIAFARQVRDVALIPNARGIMHFGPDDSSDEITFLRTLADAFGWPKTTIHPGDVKSCNIALNCDQTHALTQGRWRSTENDTIQGLLKYQEFKSYHHRA